MNSVNKDKKLKARILYLLMALFCYSVNIYAQSTMMVIHRKYGVKDSLLVSGIEKITFHQSTLNGTMVDIDGNIYTTVIIGNREWMAENLRVTHLNDGTPIPNILPNEDWASAIAPALCSYNNIWLNRLKNGLLYNGHTIATGKLAPDGWRVTRASDWVDLEEEFGTGKDLTRAIFGFQEEFSSELDSINNRSGLSILRVGNRASPGFELYNTDFYLKRENESEAIAIRFGWEGYYFDYWPVYNWYGLSVRCVRDL